MQHYHVRRPTAARPPPHQHAGEDHEDLSVKVKPRLKVSLQSLLKPWSLGEIAMTWDFCVRAVISEHARQNGGGNFSSKFGTWENFLSAA